MSPRGRPDDPAERAERILDAAADLLLRFGHDRTTIGDIARVAYVAKGSVYAHWRSREELFLAMLLREQATLLDTVGARLRESGEAADLRRFLAETVRAYQGSPVLVAVLTRNAEILGGLVRAADQPGARYNGVELLTSLRDGGWIRTDQTLAEQVTVLSAVFLGYFLTEPLMPGQFRVLGDAVPALVADTVHRALERPEPLTSDEAAAQDRVIHHHIETAADAIRERLRTSQSSVEDER